MATSAQTARQVYGPRGVSKCKAVQMRLLPLERLLFDRLKALLGISESKLGREIYLVGLPTFLAQRGLTEWANDTLKALAA